MNPKTMTENELREEIVTLSGKALGGELTAMSARRLEDLRRALAEITSARGNHGSASLRDGWQKATGA